LSIVRLLTSEERITMRVIKSIEIEGKHAIARFDTGAFHTSVLSKYLKGKKGRLVPVRRPHDVSLGGKTFPVRAEAILNGKIEGLDFNTTVIPIDSLGRPDGRFA
jgi:hypothetical protein